MKSLYDTKPTGTKLEPKSVVDIKIDHQDREAAAKEEEKKRERESDSKKRRREEKYKGEPAGGMEEGKVASKGDTNG